MPTTEDVRSAFIDAACAPLDASHSSGTLERAESILAAHPEIARGNIYIASILGDASEVRRLIDSTRGNATAKGGPRNWDALTHLCFSRYLRLDRSRSTGFVSAAKALLAAGASANTGWFEKEHQPNPGWESVLYGAAGVAHHAELTRLLVEHGADVNDGEVTYHTPESYDNEPMKILLDTGRLTEDSLGTLLVRKADWHDHDGMKLVLEKGADPNRIAHWGNTPLHHAVLRDNSLANIELMLSYGGDPNIVSPRDGRTAVSRAARRGRSDLLETFEKRGFAIPLDGVDRLIAACAKNDLVTIRSIVENESPLVQELIKEGGKLLAEFAGNDNDAGVARLLDLGVDAGATFVDGDGYWGVAPNSTALHVAAWRLSHSTVKVLVDRGAEVNARDGIGRTPLMLAVRGCVDSYWSRYRSPDSVKALLDAGATVDGVNYPSGYAEVDTLLASR